MNRGDDRFTDLVMTMNMVCQFAQLVGSDLHFEEMELIERWGSQEINWHSIFALGIVKTINTAHHHDANLSAFILDCHFVLCPLIRHYF